jgi:hypothetical protein
MSTPNVVEMIRPFDPLEADAENHYDVVVRRLNRVRARRARLGKEMGRLETQFIENDLIVATGSRRGEPLSKSGRRRRLNRLIEIGSEIKQLDEQERFSSDALIRMNEALDRWARETYSPQEAPQ